MDKNVRKKYLFSVYLIIALIASLTILVAYSIDEDFWQAILLNFSTELIGVVFIFALVNYFLFVEEWNLSEQVSMLLRKLNNETNVEAKDFFSYDAIPHRVPEEYYDSAKNVFLVGYSLSRVVRHNLGLFTKLLQRGVHFRFLILDVEDENVVQQITARTTDNLTREHWEIRLRDARALLYALRDVPNAKGQVEIGYLPFVPGFGMIFINPDENNGICFSILYPHRSADTEPAFMINAINDSGWYHFFLRQYNELWECSRKDMT